MLGGGQGITWGSEKQPMKYTQFWDNLPRKTYRH